MDLKAELPKLLDVILVNNTYCNHLDFLFSLKVNEHVNDPIKEILRTTDDLGWVYSRPSTRVVREIGNDIREDPDELSPSTVTDPNVVSVSNILAENSNVVTANTSSRLVIDNKLANVNKKIQMETGIANNSTKLHG